MLAGSTSRAGTLPKEGEAAGDLAKGWWPFNCAWLLVGSDRGERSCTGDGVVSHPVQGELRVRLAAECGPLFPRPRGCESHGFVPKPALCFLAADGL